MGHRITQRILQCAICDKTPDDGDYLWEMCGEYWCEECCDKEHEAEEIPQFAGTRDQLNALWRITEAFSSGIRMQTVAPEFYPSAGNWLLYGDL